jgi:hypothetical protein
LLRKLRKSNIQQGINLEKLNRGESKKERVDEQRFGLFGNGLQKGKGKDEVLYVLGLDVIEGLENGWELITGMKMIRRE